MYFFTCRRKCYLNNEKDLKFFKHYTKNNCEQECLAEETLKACGCVQFYMISMSVSHVSSV